MLLNVFSLGDILGSKYLERGMSTEQLIYFFNCCTVVEASAIDYSTMAFGRVMTDAEGQKGINKSIDSMRTTLTKQLLKG